jgi:LuxR family maltose regulon positive regulatory protein
MAGPLLETKIQRPRGRAGQMERTRLLERLEAATDANVVLVSAPAGFGKTTLVAQWLSHQPRAAAWLSVDGRDNEPAVFWRYVVAALRTVAPGVGADALTQLEAAAPVEAALSSLANDLHALTDDVILVIDDYHLLESRDIHDGMTFLVEHLPARLQLVLACRADPLLPLARLRARGELAEVRAADLRLTTAEAAEYLTETMGLTLTAQDVIALESRTEGWIAALQLAALSLRDRPDATAFIKDFAGDDRYIVDFLVEEVLERQPHRVRSFLLQTSVLPSLSGPLCDAVTEGEDSTAILRFLDRANLFVVPLDDRRRWYRYHHLFGDVLHALLLEEEPAVVPDLHRRASAWHERAGDRREAIRHALAGGDAETAARLLELELPALQRDRQEATLRRWIDALPDEVIRVRPVLTIAHVGSRMVHGELDGVEERLQDAERWLAASGGDGERPPGMVVVDEERTASAPCRVRSPSTGPPRPASAATCPAPSATQDAPWTWSATTTPWSGARRPRWRDWPTGRAGTSPRPCGATRTPWASSSASATGPTSRAAPSPRPTCCSPRAASVLRATSSSTCSTW